MSYDYPNWDESLAWPGSREVYQDDYERIGSPESPIQVNSYLHLLAFEKWRMAGGRDRVTFVNNYGLMQFKYGYPKYGIAPGTLPHPEDSPEGPVFGGDPAYYSPPKGMLNAPPLFCDAYHLSIGGNEELERNAMERCVEDWLNDSFR